MRLYKNKSYLQFTIFNFYSIFNNLIFKHFTLNSNCKFRISNLKEYL